MLPFMKIPVVLPGPDFDPNNPDNQKTKDKETEAWILPSEISSFHPGYYWGAVIILKSGQSFITRVEAKAIEQNIAGYWAHVTKSMGEKSKSNIVTL